MLSYVIASIRPARVKVIIESISKLPSHEYEIIICTPYPETDFQNVRFILDDKFEGSTYGVNKGVQNAKGDWVLIGADDHVINYDVSGFLNFIKTPLIESLEYQVINMGSPWTDCLSRNLDGYGIDIGSITPGVIHERWPVITFPAASKKTIDTKLDGHIFHPDLLHHFVDHYLGLYISKKQPYYDPNSFSCKTSWVEHTGGEDSCDRSRDSIDSVRFCNLAATFLQHSQAFNYTKSIL